MRIRTLSAVFLILLFELLWLAGRAGADPTAPTGSEVSGVFGEAARFPEPDPVTGAMGYAIPFQVPAARGQAQPQLALTYSSSSADREAGYGWALDLGNAAAFLTGQSGASVFGAWGDSLLLWSLTDYSQITAIPVEANADFCGIATSDPNHGAWKWVKGDEVGWSRHAEAAPSPHSQNRWFADVDGDGLPDSFGRTDSAGNDLERASVFFTKRLSKAERSAGAAMVPFATSLGLGNSLTPAEKPRSRTRFYYADINGDGLTDLITYNYNHLEPGASLADLRTYVLNYKEGDGDGIPRVRPGDGRGRFACDQSHEPATCFTPEPGTPAWVSDTFAIDVPDAQKPWPFNEDTYFHDVTGDGLADIIKYEPGNGTTPSIVRLWINQDGHTFRCATPTNFNPCQVNAIFDDLHGSFTIDPHRVTFADMDANGVDDMVVLGNSGVWASSVFNSPLASTATRLAGEDR